MSHRKKRHHFRPVLHLRRFADPAGLLWVHDRTSAIAPFQQIPQNIGYETDLYVPEGGPDGGTDAFENWLELNVDSPAAAPLEAIDDHWPLSSAEKTAVANFVAAQELRTPRARDLVISLFHEGMARQWENWAAEPQVLADAILRDSGVSYTADEIREILDQQTFRITRDPWLDFAQGLVGRLAARLMMMTWARGEATEPSHFITSDVGIVKSSGDYRNLVHWGLGFHTDRDIWLFPASSSTVIIFCPAGKQPTGPVTHDFVDAVNRHVWADASRFVYSCTRLSSAQAP